MATIVGTFLSRRSPDRNFMLGQMQIQRKCDIILPLSFTNYFGKKKGSLSLYAHRAIVTHNGAVIMDGTVREVFSQQDELESVGMRLPEIIKLGNMLGKTLLSVDEYKRVIKE